MRHEIIKTIYHFTDDKGWKYEMAIDGEVSPQRNYRIPKNAKYYEVPALMNEPPSLPIPNEHYEFYLIKEGFEHFSLNYYIKHLYYEM